MVMVWSPPAMLCIIPSNLVSPWRRGIIAIPRSLREFSALAMSGGELCPEIVLLGRKAGFCRGGVGTRLARRLALTTGVFARSIRVFAWSAGDVVSGGNGFRR